MTTRAVAAVVPRVEQPLWGALAGLLCGLVVGLLTWPQSILPGGEGGPAVGLGPAAE